MTFHKNKFFFTFFNFFFDVDFKVLTALKGWVGHAPQGRGALHNNQNLLPKYTFSPLKKKLKKVKKNLFL
jgi:hypothetical protein